MKYAGLSLALCGLLGWIIGGAYRWDRRNRERLVRVLDDVDDDDDCCGEDYVVLSHRVFAKF